ncbi:N-acetyl-D-glucosamine kinase-like [Ciona intestinalis]
MPFFGGIEGGGSKSSMIIIDENGKCVGESSGPDTNVWQIGATEVSNRINTMVMDAKNVAGIPTDQKLASLGMCLSGGEQQATNKEMIKTMSELYPLMSESLIIKSDTAGSIATACEKGGMVLISGTGSNCSLENEDGSTFGCGGWGHMMGDEGGAYWISHRAVKYVFDHDDNMESAPCDPTLVREMMYKYFKVSDRRGMLNSLYSDFSKSIFAGFCKVLAIEGCVEKSDALCLHLFKEAGTVLAKHIIALVPKADKAMLQRPDGLQVVCVGSVWKNWKYIKESFMETLRSHLQGKVSSITLVELSGNSAIGSAVIGAKHANIPISVDLSKNYRVLHQSTI